METRLSVGKSDVKWYVKGDPGQHISETAQEIINKFGARSNHHIELIFSGVQVPLLPNVSRSVDFIIEEFNRIRLRK